MLLGHTYHFAEASRHVQCTDGVAVTATCEASKQARSGLVGNGVYLQYTKLLLLYNNKGITQGQKKLPFCLIKRKFI
jgi:hypothetical protein